MDERGISAFDLGTGNSRAAIEMRREILLGSGLLKIYIIRKAEIRGKISIPKEWLRKC